MTDSQNKKLWTIDEDETLRKAVSILNNDKWNDIAKKFQQLYFESFGQVTRRAGKQCRQRWYNKLHPQLTKTVQPWSDEQSIALLGIYQQMGPKWAKIIYKLCQAGYSRRSDNNIKNHFHLMVKKSLKDLNQFIQEYNQKIKQSIPLNKVRKVYVYQKSYSIQKMLRKQLPKKRLKSVNLIQQQNEEGIQQCQENKNVLGNSKIENVRQVIGYVKNRQQVIKQVGVSNEANTDLLVNEMNDMNRTQSIKSDLQQIINNKSVQLSQQQLLAVKNEDDTTNNTKPTTLRLVDKKSIDRFWLWSNDKSTGRLQILSSVQDSQLRTVRNLFLEYMRHPELFSSQQLKQLIEQINNYTKCCKKLNKKKRQKIIKQKQDKSKYYIERTARRIYDNIIVQQPQLKKPFVKNKQQILPRLTFLITNVFNKYQRFHQNVNKDQLIGKKHEIKIKKIIIDEVGSLWEKQQLQKLDIKRQELFNKQEIIDLNPNVNNDQANVNSLILNRKNKQKRTTNNKSHKINTQQLIVPNDDNHAVNIVQGKVKKIRKYKKRQPKQKQTKATVNVGVVKMEQSQKMRGVVFVQQEDKLIDKDNNIESDNNLNRSNLNFRNTFLSSNKHILVQYQQFPVIGLDRSLTQEFFTNVNTNNGNNNDNNTNNGDNNDNNINNSNIININNNFNVISQRSIILKKQQPYQQGNFFSFMDRVKQIQEKQQQLNERIEQQQHNNNNNNKINKSSLSSSMSFNNSNNNSNNSSNNINKSNQYLMKQEQQQQNVNRNPFCSNNHNQQQVKGEDLFWNHIKMGEQSDKTTEVNNNHLINHNINHYRNHNLSQNSRGNPFHNHYTANSNNNSNNNNNNNHNNNNNNVINNRQSPETKFKPQGLYKFQFNRPFQQKHIESQQQSEYSVKSRKSIRPKMIIYPQQKNYSQFQNVKNNNNNDNFIQNNNKGSFSEIQKKFPDALVRSIEFGQQIPIKSFNGQFSPFQSDMLRNPYHHQQNNINNKPGFLFYNNQQQQPIIPFQSFPPVTHDPFRILTSSQQFLMNSSLFNKGSSMNYQQLQKPLQQSLFISNDFQGRSSENVFGQFQQQMNNGSRVSPQLSSSNSNIIVQGNNNVRGFTGGNGSCINNINNLRNSNSNIYGNNNNTNNLQNSNNYINNNQPNIPTNPNPKHSPINTNGNFFTSSFFQNIRNVQQQPITPVSNINNSLWKQPQIYSFQNQSDDNRFPFSKPSREISQFNPFISQPIDFEIPQKLIQTVKNPHFPIKNYNDYSLNYAHANSMQYSRMFEFDKKFGLNSARLSQIDLFRSQQRSQSHRSRSKQFEVGSNLFKSQKIQSIHESLQFINKSRQLSNSCIYSNHQQRSFGNNSSNGIVNGQNVQFNNNNNSTNNNRMNNSNIFVQHLNHNHSINNSNNPRYVNFPPQQIFDGFSNNNNNNMNNNRR